MKDSSPRSIASLDGLRGLAIMLVLWHHWFLLPMLAGWDTGPLALSLVPLFGFSGVFLFFVLSGFLLFLPYARALLAGTTWPLVRTFYLRRALRILPVYFLVVLFLVSTQDHTLLAPNALVLTLSLLFDWQVSIWQRLTNPIAPLWTLTIEWQFYLLLPWLALILAKVTIRKSRHSFRMRLIGFLSALIAFALLVRLLALLVFASSHTDPIASPAPLGWFFVLFFGVAGRYLEVFALGMAASFLYVWVAELGHRGIHLVRWGYAALLLSVAGLCCCLFWSVAARRIPISLGYDWIFSPTMPAWTVLGEWALGVCYALLLLAVLLGPRWLDQVFASQPLRFLGKISYSLYLWHWPLLVASRAWFTATEPGVLWRYILWTGAILLVWCSASYYLVERPFLRWRRVRPTPIKPAAVIERYHNDV